MLNRDYKAEIMNEREPQRGPAKFAWLEATVRNPPMAAETPALYRVVSLAQRQRRNRRGSACDVGFRELEIRDGRFLVNGAPIHCAREPSRNRSRPRSSLPTRA